VSDDLVEAQAVEAGAVDEGGGRQGHWGSRR
jgi:hypothetical protein